MDQQQPVASGVAGAVERTVEMVMTRGRQSAVVDQSSVDSSPLSSLYGYQCRRLLLMETRKLRDLLETDPSKDAALASKLAPKLRQLLTDGRFVRKLRRLLFYLQTYFECDLSNSSLRYTNAELDDLLQLIGKASMVSRLIPRVLQLLTDHSVTGAGSTSKLLRLRKLLIEEDGANLAPAEPAPSHTVDHQSESNSDDDDDDMSIASDVSEEWNYLCDVAQRPEAGLQWVDEEDREQVLLTQQFYFQRMEATRWKQMVRFLDTLVKVNSAGEPEGGGGSYNRWSAKAAPDEQARPFRLSKHTFSASNLDSIVSFEGPEDHRRLGGKELVKKHCLCLMNNCYCCGPFESCLHPIYRNPSRLICAQLNEAVEVATLRTMPESCDFDRLEDAVLAGLCTLQDQELSGYIRKLLYVEEDRQHLAFLSALTRWRQRDSGTPGGDKPWPVASSSSLSNKKRRSRPAASRTTEDDYGADESARRPRSGRRDAVHNSALKEKYAEKRRISALKHRRRLAQKRSGQAAAQLRTVLSTDKKPAPSRHTAQPRFKEFLEPFDSFMADDAIFLAGRSSPESEMVEIEAPSFERESTPESLTVGSGELTSDEVYFERHLPTVKQEKQINAERRRRMRAWRLKRQVMLRNRKIMKFFPPDSMPSGDAEQQREEEEEEEEACSSDYLDSSNEAPFNAADNGSDENE